ncbi:MAG: TrmH family RNA methyltransferase [Enterococcus sp.]
MKEIQSVKNPVVKEAKKLYQKKYREQQNSYLIEGFHLVEEAAKNQVLSALFFDERGQKEWGAWIDEQACEQYFVSKEVMSSLSELPHSQGIIAIVKKAVIQEIDYQGQWLLLDNVQDPGNVGTMIRTADAAGFTGVILGEGCADIYSVKVLRSMQGSNFHLPVLSGRLNEYIALLKQAGMKVYGTELNENAQSFQTVVPTQDVALIMGNEGAGVSPDLLALTDANLYIPIYGQAESLNVGIAAGVLMYHFAVGTNF